MKRYVTVLLLKIKLLFNRNCSASAVVYGSCVDRTAAIRQKVRVYESTIGRYSYIARNTLVQNTTIGSFCSISEGCNIGMPSHPLNFVSTSPIFLCGGNVLHKNFSQLPFVDCPQTIIGNDVWIGAHVQIKSGLTIGNGAVIAAGAVVTHDVPPYAIVGGIPAKVIRYRFDEETINVLQKLEWWTWDEIKLKKYGQLFNNPKLLMDCLEKDL